MGALLLLKALPGISRWCTWSDDPRVLCLHIWWKTGTLSRLSGLSELLSLSTFSQGLFSGLSSKVSHSLHDCSGDLGASISEDRKQKLLASWSLGLWYIWLVTATILCPDPGKQYTLGARVRFLVQCLWKKVPATHKEKPWMPLDRLKWKSCWNGTNLPGPIQSQAQEVTVTGIGLRAPKDVKGIQMLRSPRRQRSWDLGFPFAAQERNVGQRPKVNASLCCQFPP